MSLTVGGDFYTVVCTDTNDYGTWQTEFLEHTWVRASMPGELLRLVGTPRGESLPLHHHARVIRTSADNTHPRLDVPYPPINRLLSLDQWLEHERPVGTVLLLDCDMAFRSPIFCEVDAGSPIAQRWHDFRISAQISAVIEAISPGVVDRIRPVTWPFLMHTSDLRPLMRRWLELTIELRNELGMWESDMFAFAVLMAEREVECDLEMLAAWTPWPDEVVGDAAIVHYCQGLFDCDGQELWNKRTYEPWSPLDFNTDKAELSYARDLLKQLDNYARIRRTVSAVANERATGGV